MTCSPFVLQFGFDSRWSSPNFLSLVGRKSPLPSSRLTCLGLLPRSSLAKTMGRNTKNNPGGKNTGKPLGTTFVPYGVWEMASAAKSTAATVQVAIDCHVAVWPIQPTRHGSLQPSLKGGCQTPKHTAGKARVLKRGFTMFLAKRPKTFWALAARAACA